MNAQNPTANKSNQGGLFKGADGRSHLGIFGLVSSLFFLWALCNGMIDVMDKHFQDFLHLTKAQSAWVQFAHYLGYFLMALPAGWLARKLGYKGGILSGLAMVALGCFWFIPATQISTFWAFLLGVCVISMGLTFLETIANPYTTVLGAPQFAAVRINIAQSFNGVGWILGPIIGGMFFYSSEGAEAAHQQLWIPYAGIAGGVLLLALVFLFVRLPEIQTPDDYHLTDSNPGASKSIWSHPHFTMAVVAQFFYVAAQAGIFAFFINYVVAEIPPVGEAWRNNFWLGGSAGVAERAGNWYVSEQGATKLLAYFGFTLFSFRTSHGGVDIIESSCLSGDGNLRFGQCGDDGWHCTKVGMALLGCPFHELLFHVGDVSDDFCARHSRIGGEVETGIFFHRHGDHGWGTGTEVDGLGGGCEGDVASISCADGMFCGKNLPAP